MEPFESGMKLHGRIHDEIQFEVDKATANSIFEPSVEEQVACKLAHGMTVQQWWIERMLQVLNKNG